MGNPIYYIENPKIVRQTTKKNNLPFKIEIIKSITLKNEDGISKQYQNCWKIVKL